MIYIGTAGWSVPRISQSLFPQQGSHLARYAGIFNAAEINSSFYQEHLPTTYARWKETVPEDFRFSVKLSKKITHENKLIISKRLLANSLRAMMELEDKLAILLIQLPPKEIFDSKKVHRFMLQLRQIYQGRVALEPRNNSWLAKDAQAILTDFEITKVIASPELCGPASAKLCSAGKFFYYRLHGEPVKYRSSYGEKYLKELSEKILKHKKDSWVIFDNTTVGEATGNALTLKKFV